MFFITFVVIGIGALGFTDAVPLSSDHQTRIIGGVDAPKGYTPHLVSLLIGDRPQRHLCGGSIISRKLVLTAAHCIDEVVLPNGQLMPSFRIRVGSNQWNSGGKIVQVNTYHNHPQWDPHNIKYDAGVLVLKDHLVLNHYVAIVKLLFDYIGRNVKCFVTGWGVTGPRIENDIVNLAPTPYNLQLLHVNTLSYEQCKRQLSQVAGNHSAPHIDKNVEICTFHSYGHGMCMGDSGGALILKSTRELIGIVSWGWNCADGGPDVFVRVYGIKPFLKTMLALHD